MKGNHIVINFTQRVRMGEYFGIPKIKSAMVEVQQRKYYIFKNQKDEQYYNQRAKSITSFFLKIPLKYRRISSRFTYKRYHPILKKYNKITKSSLSKFSKPCFRKKSNRYYWC